MNYILQKGATINLDDLKTIRGYSIERLEQVAMLLSTHEITVYDIEKMCHNIEFVRDLFVEQQDKQMKRAMENLTIKL